MPDLIAEKIEKQLGTAQILRGVSFQLQEREILALLGASGSGKTTLLRSVAGLEQPDAGKIEIRGKLVFDAASGFEVPAEQLQATLDEALAQAERNEVTGRELTPFLLSEMAQRSGGATLRANIALLENNARVAAEIASRLDS